MTTAFRQVRPNYESINRDGRSCTVLYVVYANVYICESINCERRKNSQFAIKESSQLKSRPTIYETTILIAHTCSINTHPPHTCR